MTFMGHKQVLWLQYGETVWNKGDGTSKGTTGVVLCNSFVGQRGPSRGLKGHTKGPMRPKTSFFGHKWVWWLQSGGTVWNKGTSQGTSEVMHWNSLVMTQSLEIEPFRQYFGQVCKLGDCSHVLMRVAFSKSVFHDNQ